MAEFVTAIVLAAGLSRRMGNENKLLLPFGDSTILGTTLTQILNAQLGETFLVLGHEAAAVLQSLSDGVIPNHPVTWTEDPSVFSISDVGFRMSDDANTFRKFLKFPKREAEPKSNNLSSINYQLSSINYQLSVIINPHFEKGMTTSIQAGVAAADKEGRGGGYMMCLSDMPFITSAGYQYLKNEFLKRLMIDNQAIVQPIFRNERGNPTVFSSFYKKHILELDYTEGCKPIVQAYKNHLYLVEMPTDAVLRDIDEKGQYKNAIIGGY